MKIVGALANEFLKRRCNEYWKEAGLNNDYFE